MGKRRRGQVNGSELRPSRQRAILVLASPKAQPIIGNTGNSIDTVRCSGRVFLDGVPHNGGVGKRMV